MDSANWRLLFCLILFCLCGKFSFNNPDVVWRGFRPRIFFEGMLNHSPKWHLIKVKFICWDWSCYRREGTVTPIWKSIFFVSLGNTFNPFNEAGMRCTTRIVSEQPWHLAQHNPVSVPDWFRGFKKQWHLFGAKLGINPPCSWCSPLPKRRTLRKTHSSLLSSFAFYFLSLFLLHHFLFLLFPLSLFLVIFFFFFLSPFSFFCFPLFNLFCLCYLFSFPFF